MDEIFDFKQMYEDLSYIGCNDSYVRNIYYGLLNSLNKLAELQKKNLIIINTMEN